MDASYFIAMPQNPFLHYPEFAYRAQSKPASQPQYHEQMAYHHQQHNPHFPQQCHHFAQTPMPVYSQHAYPHGIATPLATPQPVKEPRQNVFFTPRPFAINTDCSPSTPPLSATSSAVSTPPSACDYLSTPINGAPVRWLKSQSPPITPG